MFGVVVGNGHSTELGVKMRAFWDQMLGIGTGHSYKPFAPADLVPAEGINQEMVNELIDQFLVGDDPAAPGNLFFGCFDPDTTRDLVRKAGFAIVETALEVQIEQDTVIPYHWVLA